MEYQNHKNSMNYIYNKLYILNESLFGQPEKSVIKMFEETGIALNINFENCYMIITGISKNFYDGKFNIQRDKAVLIFLDLQDYIGNIEDKYNCNIEIGILNYDLSKRVVLIISPKTKNADIENIAKEVTSFLQKEYVKYSENKEIIPQNTLVLSSKITSFEEYQQQFNILQQLYNLSFFDKTIMPITEKAIQSKKTSTALLEIEVDFKNFENAFYFESYKQVKKILDNIFLDKVQKSFDIDFCKKAIMLLKKELETISLLLNQGQLDINENLDDYFSFEEFYLSIVEKVESLYKKAGISTVKPSHLSVQAAMFVKENYHRDIGLEIIADTLHVNATYLSRVFKGEIGKGISAYITDMRLEKAKELLEKTNLKVSQIAAQVGIEDANYFGVIFKKKIGMRPQEYRKK